MWQIPHSPVTFALRFYWCAKQRPTLSRFVYLFVNCATTACVCFLAVAIALCKHSQAEWNATKAPANKTVSCSPHDNSSNCAGTVFLNPPWLLQFSLPSLSLNHWSYAYAKVSHTYIYTLLLVLSLYCSLLCDKEFVRTCISPWPCALWGLIVAISSLRLLVWNSFLKLGSTVCLLLSVKGMHMSWRSYWISKLYQWSNCTSFGLIL